jgi:hypothetical protein
MIPDLIVFSLFGEMPGAVEVSTGQATLHFALRSPRHNLRKVI